MHTMMLFDDVAVGPCATNYGNCSQFCWTLSSNTSVCDCAPGFFLTSDGKTCSPRKSHSNTVLYTRFENLCSPEIHPVANNMRNIEKLN